MKKLFLFVILSLGIVFISYGGYSDNCSEIIKTKITTEEYLSESQSFNELKNYLINLSLENAVQQVIGVSKFQSLSLSQENGVEIENFSETTTLTSKTKGTIDSYEIISTEIIDLDTVKILSLEVEAYVCVKDNQDLLKI